jgi:putative flavoprotein involved in K+ transport
MALIKALHGPTLVTSRTAPPLSRPACRAPACKAAAGHHRRRPGGLSLSALLQEAGVEHRVLEAETVGASWQRRWESFQTNTANATMALHGHAYAGDDPEGFMGAPEVIRHLRDYAHERSLPISEGCGVHRVGPGPGGYAIDSSQGLIHARAVVVATGEYRRARMPRVPFAPAPGLTVLHSGDYRSARQLPDGAVLVIGVGSPARRSPRTCATAVAACTGHWPSGIRIPAGCAARTR